MQEVAAKSAGYDLKKNVKCLISPTETGFSIAFVYYVKEPIDVTANQASGKKGYDYYQAKSEFSVSSSDNSVTEVISTRDATGGMPTGKRQYKPLTVTAEIDKSTPVIYNRASSSGTIVDGSTVVESSGGAGKVNMQDINFTKRCGGNTTVFSVVDGVCVIPTGDCPNGDCKLKIEWTWNDGAISHETSTGMTEMSRNSAELLLKIEDGVCTAMAINEKGLPGDKPRKPKTKN